VTPDFTAITNTKVWIVAFTIAVVASIETLLCIEAADRMDAQKRYTDTNVELKAQGIGNILSALLGGLPMTSVVVRTSANNNAGAKSKMSAIIHGILLLVSVLAIPTLLNKIPLATLAAVLLLVGYKLANPNIIKHFWEKGKYQFIPFMATFIGVVFTDLLKGVTLGIIISIIFVLKGNMKRAYNFRKEEYQEGDIIHIDLAQEVSFLNKAAIKATLNKIPSNSKVVINATDTDYIAHDVLDLIKEFKKIKSKELNISTKLVGFKDAYDIENSDGYKNKVTIEHRYNVMKRKMEVIENKEIIFKDDKL
jgi:MFS superfamily sulfate permease-like transporter